MIESKTYHTSMDWFKGTFTGTPHKKGGKIDGFRFFRFSPLNQSLFGPAQAPGSTRKKCPKLQATESCPASDGKDSNFNLFDAPHENTVPFV